MSFITGISPDTQAVIIVTLGMGLLGSLIGLAKYYLKTHDIEKRYAEKCSQYEMEKGKSENLQRTLDEKTRVEVFRDWIFFSHDPPPRHPLCPVCHVKGNDIRMHLDITDGPPPFSLRHYFYCRCGHQQYIRKDIVTTLGELLGDKNLKRFE